MYARDKAKLFTAAIQVNGLHKLEHFATSKSSNPKLDNKTTKAFPTKW